MNLRVVLLALALTAAGVGAVVYKISALGYELVPQAAEDRWAVQMQLRLRGTGDRARIRLYLPKDRPDQRIYDERVLSEGMKFYIRPKGGNRVGYLSAELDGASTASYRFSVDLDRVDRPLPTPEEVDAGLDADVDARYLEGTKYIQTSDERVAARLAEIVAPDTDHLERLRAIFDYVQDEVLTIDPTEESDALTVLQKERGGTLGKARLLVALARVAGIPARVAGGFDLEEGSRSETDYWAEAFVGGRWLPVDPVAGYFGTLPPRRLLIFEGDRGIVWVRGLESHQLRISALKEELSQRRVYERRVRRSDALLDQISLFRLPVRTQMTLRLLLLIPFGALVVAVFRNLVGVPTFGTFMPVLIALAFIETTLSIGIVLLLTIIGVGWAFRALLDRLQLLLVPRLVTLLTIVIGIVVAISLISERMALSTGLSVSLFPIVILTLTIERFSIVTIEEGTRNALKATAGTLVVAIASYSVVANEMLQRMVLAFPELLLVVIAVSLIIGRYTGYRLSEWVRFSSFRNRPTGV